MLFRNIQAISSQDAVALIFARAVQASAEACCCCAVLRKLIVARRLRHRIFGLQHRRSICSAVHVKVGRLFPLLRSLVGLSLFYSPVFTTEDHTAFFLQEILDFCSRQLACVGHQKKKKKKWLLESGLLRCICTFAPVRSFFEKQDEFDQCSNQDKTSCLCLAQTPTIYETPAIHQFSGSWAV